MKQKGNEKYIIMEIIGGAYIVYYLRITYVVSIEEMEISCVGDQSSGKSQIYSDFINSHFCEVAQWLSRNLLVVSVNA